MGKRADIQAGLEEYADELAEADRIYWENDCNCCCCTGEGH